MTQVPNDPQVLQCDECGHDFVINIDGTANHLVPDSVGISEIDYDLDDDHVAYTRGDDDGVPD